MRKKIKSRCATIALVGTILVGFTACSQDDIFDETLNNSLTYFMNYAPFKERYDVYRTNYQKYHHE